MQRCISCVELISSFVGRKVGGRARLTTFVAIEATSSALLDYSHFYALPEFAGTSVSLMEKSA